MKPISTHAQDLLRRYWLWISVALLIMAGLIHALVTGTFQIASEPPGGFKNITKPSDANYPKQDSHPQRVVTISGTMPANLPIQLIAIYWTEIPTEELSDHKDCYRSAFIGPRRPLFTAQQLALANKNGKYETSVTVDKYVSGFCHWQLGTVVFALGDEGNKSGNDIFNGGVYRTAIVFEEPTPSLSFRGPINIWCAKLRDGEFCSTWLGVAGKRFSDDVPVDERGDESQTLLTPEMSSTIMNFHDFDALPVETSPQKSH